MATGYCLYSQQHRCLVGFSVIRTQRLRHPYNKMGESCPDDSLSQSFEADFP